MFYWSFTSLVHFWPPPIFNSGYAYVALYTAFVFIFTVFYNIVLHMLRNKYINKLHAGAVMPYGSPTFALYYATVTRAPTILGASNSET